MAYPANKWQDALPAGNGISAALLYGNIYKDKILLNHENYWYDNLHCNLPDVSHSIKEIRFMLERGNYKEANEFLVNTLKKEGYKPQVAKYYPGPSINFTYEPSKVFVEYERCINCSTGEVSVTWSEGYTKYKKRLFVSRADNVVAFNITNDAKKPMRHEISIGLHDEKQLVKENKTVSILQNGLCGRKFIFRALHEDSAAFGCTVLIDTDGEVIEKNGNIMVVGATDLTLISSLTDPNDNEADDLSRLYDNGSLMSYGALLYRHTEEYRLLYDKSSLRLTNGTTYDYVENMLLEAYRGNVNTQFYEMMYNYGRYLLISGCSSLSLPLNLQGKWNGHYNPMWQSGYISNENIQMCYWQALRGNLPEMVESYFNLFDMLMDDFRKNASKIFGCRGIYIPLLFTPKSGVSEDLQPHCLYWMSGAAWISKLYYDYWQYTRDEAMLIDRILPMLNETALFYKDFFYENEKGLLVSAPSNSPENAPPQFVNKDNYMINDIEVQINSTIDFAAAKEVVSNLINVLTYLEYESSVIEEWQTFIEKFPDYAINDDGAIMEWLHEDFEDNYHHRHESHIYPAFPGNEIIEEYNCTMFEACKTALDKRLIIGIKEQTGWSLMHMANARARFGEGEKSKECLDMAIRSCVGNNLFMYHNDWRQQGITLDLLKDNEGIFQIDANMGFSSAILEMLLYSSDGLIKILPSLPEEWIKGKYENMLCAGNILISVEWDRSRSFLDVELKTRFPQTVVVKIPEWAKTVKFNRKYSKERSDILNKVFELNVE